MTTPLPNLAAEERADARFAEQIAAHARQYLAYLDARLTLLEIEAARASVAFERAEGRDGEERAAQAAITSLPPASRALFAAVVEQERLEIQSDQSGRGTNPDDATALALRRLRDEANGVGTEGGKGLIPRGTPEAIKWYAVDVAALRAAPSAAAYAAGSSDTRTRRRMVWQAGAALAVLLLALIWLFIPKAHRQPTSTTADVATANGAALAAWPVRAIVVTATHGDTVTVPVSPTTTLNWPGETADLHASWYTASAWPLRLCVPSTLLASAKQVRVIGTGDEPDRIYTLASETVASADLILAPCTAEGGASHVRQGKLSTTVPLQVHALNESAALPIGAITPSAITLTGPGQDPTLPPDQARVSVRVRAPDTIDWPVLAPTLLLTSGAAILPSDVRADGHDNELRYLIPLPSASLPVIWQIRPTPESPVIRWQATLEPPPTRMEMLRAALRVEPPRVTAGDAPGTVAIALAVVNRGTAPLQLANGDISLAAANQPPLIPELAALRQPLAPGERRTVMLNAALEERSTLTLTVGVARFAIDRTEGGDAGASR